MVVRAVRDVPRVLVMACVGIGGCYRGVGDGLGAGGTTSGETGGDPTSASSQTVADDDDDASVDDTADAVGDPDTTDPSDPSATDPTDTSATDPTDASDSDASTTDGGNDDVAETCMRWNADRADLSEGSWSGSVGACNPGDISAGARDNALRVVNLYRWIADLPPITTDPARDALAQACALMMTANDALSHSPPADWTCYSADGAQAAANSNIASTAGVFAVDLYMVDPGNPTTLGHRRWILSNSIGPTGIGSTDSYSCMWTIGGAGNVGADWMAWPPPGAFPIAASQLPWTSMDETGWSIQSDTRDFAGAQVEITAGGEARPVAVSVLGSGYGSTFAISMIPQGWAMTAGTTYHVRIDGAGPTIEYDVDVVDCG